MTRQAALVLGRPAPASALYRTLDGIGPVQLARTAVAPRTAGTTSNLSASRRSAG